MKCDNPFILSMSHKSPSDHPHHFSICLIPSFLNPSLSPEPSKGNMIRWPVSSPIIWKSDFTPWVLQQPAGSHSSLGSNSNDGRGNNDHGWLLRALTITRHCTRHCENISYNLPQIPRSRNHYLNIPQVMKRRLREVKAAACMGK